MGLLSPSVGIVDIAGILQNREVGVGEELAVSITVELIFVLIGKERVGRGDVVGVLNVDKRLVLIVTGGVGDICVEERSPVLKSKEDWTVGV